MRALACLLLLVPVAAWADPISAIGFLASAWAASGAVIAGFTLTAGWAFAINVGLAIIGTAQARRKAKSAAAAQRAQYNASLQDRSVTVLRGDPPWQVVYGRAIVGGAIVDIFTSDKAATNENGDAYTRADAYKHLVIVWAAHECEAINDIYIDGVAVGALDGSGLPTGGEFVRGKPGTRLVSFTTSVTVAETPLTVISAFSVNGTGIDEVLNPETVTISGNTLTGPTGVAVSCNYTVSPSSAAVRISHMLGSTTQARNTYLGSIAPTRYTTAHRLRGLCYSVITLDLEEPRFQAGPPNITADVQGRMLYDTRIAGPASTGDNSNPALVVRDFLTAPWGFEAADADIDDAYCNAAANACDANISLDVGGTVTTGQDTYTCNGSFTTDQSAESILEELTESMAGNVVYGAQWQINAGTWTASVMTLTDDDLNGVIEVLQADTATEDLFNGVRGQLVVRGAQTPSDFNPYQNATFAADDGRDLWTNVTLPFTDDLARARNLTRIFVERNRAGQVIRYPAKLRAWVLQVGDRVTVTSAEYGFSSKTYRVTDWQFDVTSAVVLTLQEDDASIYDLADAALADPTPNTNLPNPWVVEDISGLAAASGDSYVIRRADGTVVPRVRVQWTAVTDSQVIEGGRVIVRWRRNAEVTWQRVPDVLATDRRAWISDAKEGDRLVIQVQAVNKYGARGDAASVGHTVTGKASDPSNVASFAGSVGKTKITWSWDRPPDGDYDETELRSGGSSWGTATFEWRGRATKYVQAITAAGSYTMRARHFDKSGNDSASTASDTVTVDAEDADEVQPFSVGVIDYQISTGIAANARFRLNRDGSIEKKIGSGSWTASGDWFSPSGGTPGDDYSVRVTTTGASLSTGTLNTWLALSTAREFHNTQAVVGGVGERETNLTLLIAANGSDTPLATGAGYLLAGYEA